MYDDDDETLLPPFCPFCNRELTPDELMVHEHTWTLLDVPVIDGVATLPDGRTLRSTANVVRVPVLNLTS